jgi:tetratricopeptide (TPR) repeat protein
MNDHEKTYYPTPAQAAAGHYQKALFYKHQNKYNEALQHLQQAININPNDINYCIEMAICYLHLDNPNRAVNILSPLYVKYPKNTAVIKPLCIALLDSGQMDKAKGILSEAEELMASDLALKALWDKVSD